MKRFLSVSLVAVLAVSPMVASATDTCPGAPNNGDCTENVETNGPGANGYSLSTSATNDGTNVVTASYVKGAYNDLTRKINKVAADKQNLLSNGAQENSGINSTVQTSVRARGIASDNYLVTEKAVTDAIFSVSGDIRRKQNQLKSGSASGSFMDEIVKTTVATGVENDATSATSLVSESAVRTAIDNVASDTMTLTNKTFDANGTGNSISNLEVGDFAQNVVVTTIGAAEGANAATDTELPTALAVRNAIASATGTATTGMVTLTGTQTLTGKTIDADDNTISDLEADNFKSGVIQTSVRAAANISDDTTLVSEKAVRTALDNQRINILAEWGSNTVTQTTIAPTPTQQ